MMELVREIMEATNRELMTWYDEAKCVNVSESEKPWGLTREEFAKLRIVIRNEIIRRMEGGC